MSQKKTIPPVRDSSMLPSQALEARESKAKVVTEDGDVSASVAVLPGKVLSHKLIEIKEYHKSDIDRLNYALNILFGKNNLEKKVTSEEDPIGHAEGLGRYKGIILSLNSNKSLKIQLSVATRWARGKKGTTTTTMKNAWYGVQSFMKDFYMNSILPVHSDMPLLNEAYVEIPGFIPGMKARPTQQGPVTKAAPKKSRQVSSSAKTRSEVGIEEIRTFDTTTTEKAAGSIVSDGEAGSKRVDVFAKMAFDADPEYVTLIKLKNNLEKGYAYGRYKTTSVPMVTALPIPETERPFNGMVSRGPGNLN